MRTLLPYCLWACLGAGQVAAQNVAIVNGRVVVGNGAVIQSGAVIIRAGKIVSVSAGAANTQGLQTIDAKGMTAMPGYIDSHRHINTGPKEKEQMQQLLEAGYTTILSGGGPRKATSRSGTTLKRASSTGRELSRRARFASTALPNRPAPRSAGLPG